MATTNSLLTAHIVVQFADAESNVSVVAEVDDREDGFNVGKTSFYSGDTPHLLLFVPAGYEVLSVMTSAGAVSFVTDTFKDIDTFLAFANEDSVSMSYPISGAWAYTWLGASLGVLTASDQFTAKLPARGFDAGTKKPIPEYRVGVAQATYTSDCKVYKLFNVPPLVSQVMVFFVVKKIV